VQNCSEVVRACCGWRSALGMCFENVSMVGRWPPAETADPGNAIAAAANVGH
jgi:hypothetical protein